jgi:chromate transporter
VPLAIALLAAVLLFRLRWPVLRTLGVCALLGLVAGLVGLPVS